jgi:hypothetical protein
MSITEEHVETPALEASPTVAARRQSRTPNRIRLSGRVVAGALALGVMVGAAGGYATYRASPNASAAGREADSTRLQAQADAYFAGQEAVARGRAADSARLQAQADAYFAGQEAVARGRAADSARLEAQADAYFAGQEAVASGRAADSARREAQAANPRS